MAPLRLDSFANPCLFLIFSHVITSFHLHLSFARYHTLPIASERHLLRPLTGSPAIPMASNLVPSLHSTGAAGGKNAAPPNGWTRKDRPCDACRRRKSRCIIPEGTQVCMMCHSRSEECTFVQSPQRRKRRKVEDGENSPEANKSRHVSDSSTKD